MPTFQEIVSRRTRTAKHYEILNDQGQPTGQYRAIIHGKTIHYEPTGPGTGNWQDVDPRLEIITGGWQATKNYWTAQFASSYGATWPVTLSRRSGFTLRYKVAAVGHVATDRTLTVLQTVQAAVGTVEPVPEAATYNQLRYAGVFTGVDVVYHPDHDYLKQDIIISVAAKQALRQAIIAQGLDQQGWLAIAVRLDVSGLAGWALGLTDDNETEEGVPFYHPVSWVHRAKDHLAKVTIRDESEATPDIRPRYRMVTHATYGKLLIMLVPLPWLAQSVGAVTIDPTYIGEVADGEIYGYAATYATARSTSYACDTATAAQRYGQKYPATPNYYQCFRLYLSLDTSGIPDTAIVTAASLYLYSEGHSGANYTGKLYRYAWSEALCTDSEGNWDGAYGGSATYEADFPNVDVWTANSWASVSVATAGINLTGDTKYSLCSSKDVGNTAPTAVEVDNIRMADYAGTTSDPYLDVTYTTVQIKKAAGVAQASIKVVGKVAIASVKKLAGVSNV